jgi:hypothetical protein
MARILNTTQPRDRSSALWLSLLLRFHELCDRGVDSTIDNNYHADKRRPFNGGNRPVLNLIPARKRTLWSLNRQRS